MNPILRKYLDQVRRNLSGIGLAEREDVLGEIRAHLEQAAADERSRNPDLSEDEAFLRATSGFGEAKEIGIRHGPQGGIVDRTTGEVLLDVAVLTGRGIGRTARAAGRGVRSVLKWGAIATAALMIIAVIVVVAYREPITENIEQQRDTRRVYEYQRSWGDQDLQTKVETDSFDVRPGRVVDFTVSVQALRGCGGIQVTGPDGAILYQNGQGCDATSVTRTWSQTGTYEVRYTYVAFAGIVSLHGTEHA